jgi:hypothetical protein
MPAEYRLTDLRAVYRAMQAMMFDETPLTFGEVLARIERSQATINAKGPMVETST